MNWIQDTATQSQLALWVFVLIGCWLLTGILNWLQRRLLARMTRMSRRTETSLDDLVVNALTRTSHKLLFFLIFVACVLWLEPSPAAHKLSLIGLRVGMIIQIFLWIDGGLNFTIESRIRKRGNGRTGALDLLRGVSRMFLLVLAVLLALDVFGVNITALVAGLGIGGVAVALALQNILSDLFSSLSIVLDKPFEVGHFISAGDDMGTVERIGLKTTRVRTLSGEQLVFPNSNLLQSRIRNFQRQVERRVLIRINVDYSVGVDQLKLIPPMIAEAVKAQPEARFDRSHLAGFGDSGYVFETVYWVTHADYTRHMDLQQAVYLRLIEGFARQRITIGVPARKLQNMTISPNGLDPSEQEPMGRGAP